MSIVQRFHQSMPKTLLFGLYGALGGLLGALLLGELLWAGLAPPPAKAPPLRVALSSSASLYPGASNKIHLKIERNDFQGKVSIVTRAPEFLEVPRLDIPEDQSEAELQITAAEELPVGEHTIEILATGPKSDSVGTPQVLSKMNIKVLPPPPALAVSASPKIEVHQGTGSLVSLRLAQRGLTQPVTIRVENLPRGLSVQDSIQMPVGRLQRDIVLRASPDAVRGEHPITIKASHPGVPDAVFQTKAQVLDRIKVDVLFVLDVTGSMAGEINGIKLGIQTFVDALEEKGLDARVGLLAFRDLKNDPVDSMKILRFEGEVLTKNLTAFRREVGKITAKGGKDPEESSFEALRLASEQPFREGAIRVLLLITDAPPRRDATTPTDDQLAKKLKDNSIDQLHLVTQGDPHKKQYEAPRDKAGIKGDFFRLTADGKKDFNKFLPKLGEAVANSSAPETRVTPATPPKTSTASLPASGEAVLKSLQSTSRYAKADRWKLLYAMGVWTAIIAASICALILMAQNYYLRESFFDLNLIAAGLVGGLLAGFLGGIVGLFLFQSLPTEMAVAEHLFRVPGWALLGALAGLGMSFCIPNFKAKSGLFGGLLGGVAAAIGFMALAWIGSNYLGRVLGAVLLGFFLGLMVALVEQAFRAFWLEISSGSVEKRSVTLGPEPVSIGSDASRCTIYARNADPIAFKFWYGNGQVHCENVSTGQVRPMKVGEAQTVGASTVTLKGASGDEEAPAISTAMPKKAPPPPPVKKAAKLPSTPPQQQPTARPASAPPPSGNRSISPVPPPPPAPIPGRKRNLVCSHCQHAHMPLPGGKSPSKCAKCGEPFA